MGKDKQNYEYLLRLYSTVGEYLSNVPTKQENLPEMVVSFCIVTEKILKIKLHDENPILVYESAKFKNNNTLLAAVVKNKELSIDTIRIGDVLDRYKLLFDSQFSDDEIQVLIDLYNIRNHFIHGYKSDDNILSDKENIVKKMGTVWEKISNQAISIFGKENIKANEPKKKYSEEELEKILIDEVKKKITPIKNMSETLFFSSLNVPSTYSPSSVYGCTISEQCPRCNSYEFYLDESGLDSLSVASVYGSTFAASNLYKCRRCGLELTKKEYEITKKLK